jgi:L-ribulose-5-phosphate 3-epimerase
MLTETVIHSVVVEQFHQGLLPCATNQRKHLVITRRTFLSATCATAVVSTVRLMANDSSTDIGRHIYKSLKWDMIKVNGSTLEKFRLIKELGYDGVELNSPDDVDKSEALQASQEVGLPIEGMVNSTHWKIRHSDPDEAVRAEALKNMQVAMREAKQVGADSVLLVPGKVTDPVRENHDQVWDRSISEIRRLLPLAEELRVRILIENVGNDFCIDPKLFAQYIDEINSPWVGVHFDIGNHVRFSQPAHWIRILGTRIRKLDAKDRVEGSRELAPFGDGAVDWQAVRQALTDVGYRGWCAAEVNGGDREQLADVLARMDRMLGKSDGLPADDLPGATKAAGS